MEVIDKMKGDLAGNIVDTPLRRGQVENVIKSSLKGSIDSLQRYGT